MAIAAATVFMGCAPPAPLSSSALRAREAAARGRALALPLRRCSAAAMGAASAARLSAAHDDSIQQAMSANSESGRLVSGWGAMKKYVLHRDLDCMP